MDGPVWDESRPRLAENGSGVLPAVPARAVDVRFGARGYADRIVRVGLEETIDVVLEPGPMLEVRLLDPKCDHLVLTAARSAFDWDNAGPNEEARHKESDALFQRLKSQAGGFVYEIRPASATFSLVGLTPDLTLTLEARDVEEHVLDTGTLALRPSEHAVLELGTRDPSGALPLLGGRRLLRKSSSR